MDRVAVQRRRRPLSIASFAVAAIVLLAFVSIVLLVVAGGALGVGVSAADDAEIATAHSAGTATAYSAEFATARSSGTATAHSSGTATAASAGATTPLVGGARPVDASASAAATCSSTGNGSAVVASLPAGSSYGPGDAVAVYRGTELVLELCRGAEAPLDARLDAASADGFTVVTATDDRVRVRVDRTVTVNGSAAGSGAALGALVDPEPVAGPTLTVVDPSAETTLVEGSLAVPTAERATDLADAEATFHERERVLREQLDELEGSNVENRGFEETAAAYGEYHDAYERLRELLFDVAASPVGTARTTAAIAELADQNADVNDRIDEQAGDYDAALLDRERSLTWSLRTRILGLGAIGLLVGVALGAALPFRRGRAARRRLRRGEWATYARKTGIYPAIVGGAVLLAGLAWFALRVGWVVLEVVT